MDSVWIVHRDARVRAALLRLVGGELRARAAAPADEELARMPPPAAVVLGLCGDLEPELELARTLAARRADLHWVLLHERGADAVQLARLFAGLRLELLAWPPSAAALRRALGRTRSRPLPLPLRQLGDDLERRAARFFPDLTWPPGLEAGRPPERVLVRGEPGTGRLLLLRWLHARSRDAAAPFLAVACEGTLTLRRLEAQLGAAPGGPEPLCCCLLEVERLAPAVQRGLAAWLEIGAGPTGPAGRPIRFSGTAGAGEVLQPELEAALARRVVELPPLRERADLVEPFAVVTLADWSARAGREPPALTPESLAALCEHPWPGNLRELEAVLLRSAAAAPGDVIPPEQLAFEATASPAEAATPAPEQTPLPDAEDALAALGLEVLEATPGRDARAVDAAAAGASTDREPLPPAPETGSETAPPLPAPAAATATGDGVREEPAAPPVSAAEAELPLARMARALAHEVRNPLVAIRTFASLLPERFDDPEFRARFRELVGDELGRVEALLDRLAEYGMLESPTLEPLDATGVLEGVLEGERPRIQERRLLVLQELDTSRPLALADRRLLPLALEALVSRALCWVPERADLFVATQHHAAGPAGSPTVRILLRFYSPGRPTPRPGEGPPAAMDLSLAESSLDVVLAESLIRAQNGSLHFDSTEADESVMWIDLPAAS